MFRMSTVVTSSGIKFGRELNVKVTISGEKTVQYSSHMQLKKETPNKK